MDVRLSRSTRARRGLVIGLAVSLVGIAQLGAFARDAAADAAASAPSASKRAWLGVELERGPAGGVIAKHVITSSPAGRAGIVDGDQIIAADGATLDEPRDLVTRVAQTGPNNPLSIRVRHGGVERDVIALLLPHPGADQVLRLDKVGTFAPTWTGVSEVTGALPKTIGGLRGRVVVLDFWAAWCGPCRMMAPVLSRWQAKLGAQGLTVIGVTTDPVPIASRAAFALDMRYTIASDTSEQMTRAYNVSGLPTLYIVDKKGVIREVYVGYDAARHEAIERLIASLLAEPTPAGGVGGQ